MSSNVLNSLLECPKMSGIFNVLSGAGDFVVYTVDVIRIARQEKCLRECAHVLCELKKMPLTDPIYLFALARAVHISIESIAEIGTVVIDGFLMRDPGGYLDIIEILEDEAVLSGGVSTSIREFIRFRDALVRGYDVLQGSELRPFLDKGDVLEQFIQSVNEYLKNEMV